MTEDTMIALAALILAIILGISGNYWNHRSIKTIESQLHGQAKDGERLKALEATSGPTTDPHETKLAIEKEKTERLKRKQGEKLLKELWGYITQ
jgi:uncharacterized membrane protein YraQ (UPF0718 family)